MLMQLSLCSFNVVARFESLKSGEALDLPLGWWAMCPETGGVMGERESRERRSEERACLHAFGY
jgi:hypothetical protein